jgi:lipoprotein-anchoring transpeptidase ErfK/SrfK
MGRRRELVVLAALVAVIVAASVSLLGVRLAGGHPSDPQAVHRYRPVHSAPLSTTTTEPRQSTVQQELAKMPAGSRAVAYAKVPSITAYATPATVSPVSTLSNPNSLGAPLVFLVQSAQADWIDVLLPQRPNGSSGWIRASQVKLYSDGFYVVVHLASHQLQLYQGGRLVQTHSVAVGDSSSPTPSGQFYVTELVASGNPNGAYGPYAFGLSDFSDTYTEFDGGPGQIAIHGTDQPWVIGTSASHGCVRLENSQLVQLVKVLPVGTPVSITTG